MAAPSTLVMVSDTLLSQENQAPTTTTTTTNSTSFSKYSTPPIQNATVTLSDSDRNRVRETALSLYWLKTVLIGQNDRDLVKSADELAKQILHRLTLIDYLGQLNEIKPTTANGNMSMGEFRDQAVYPRPDPAAVAEQPYIKAPYPSHDLSVETGYSGGAAWLGKALQKNPDRVSVPLPHEREFTKETRTLDVPKGEFLVRQFKSICNLPQIKEEVNNALTKIREQGKFYARVERTGRPTCLDMGFNNAGSEYRGQYMFVAPRHHVIAVWEGRFFKTMVEIVFFDPLAAVPIEMPPPAQNTARNHKNAKKKKERVLKRSERPTDGEEPGDINDTILYFSFCHISLSKYKIPLVSL